ncbi:hypothetical protein IDJ81_05640 [Tsuneonella flava]|uniref:Uncharacterized protein n=1 Tax=Tsuneonella flava TaxID=2055955 RepID=A0ABX7KBD9_9SPHN|nr:hypothetical protein [Tsuneonella flava]QSB45591.1 hypothetical protein IDJ81_05640 [Tsuneonella flava]
MDRRLIALFAIIALPAVLGGCRPPATDRYVERLDLDSGQGPTHVLTSSPDVAGAIWAVSRTPNRIVYGIPGNAPLLALACTGKDSARTLEITRFAAADRNAKAIMALIGNGHVERLPIDAKDNGRGWLWQGSYPADLPALDAFTGARKLELTIPGAGTLAINPSPQPAELIETCRRLAQPDPAVIPVPELETEKPTQTIVPKAEPTPPT